MAEEPIGVKPGAYPSSGGQLMKGICLLLDSQATNWTVEEGEDGTTTVTIPSDSKWKVFYGADPDDPTETYLQVFRQDGNLNSVVLQSFIHPTPDVHTPDANHPEGKPSQLQIFYTHPNSLAVSAEEVEPTEVKRAKRKK